jgi:hypothetical protein
MGLLVYQKAIKNNAKVYEFFGRPYTVIEAAIFSCPDILLFMLFLIPDPKWFVL